MLGKAKKAAKADLDETRRCLYMAAHASRTVNGIGPELAGTICNALLHHSDQIGADAQEFVRDWQNGATDAPPPEFLLACAFSIGLALENL